MARVYQKSRGPTVAGRKRWYIDYVDAAGRRRRERTDAQTKGEADSVLRARLSANERALSSSRKYLPEVKRENVSIIPLLVGP